jgi:hypothetical protein
VQERKGQAVASEDLLGSAVLPAALPQPGTAITAVAGDSKKEKRKRDKKDKKERKEEKKVSCFPEARIAAIRTGALPTGHYESVHADIKWFLCCSCSENHCLQQHEMATQQQIAWPLELSSRGCQVS